MTFTLTDYNPYDFANRRHIGPSPDEIRAMLDTIGVESLDQLIDEVIPGALRDKDRPKPNVPPLSERDALHQIQAVAERNQTLTSLIGQGFYNTVTPPPILRNIFENPAWYTAYTPYQAEIAQGRLEALLNFQTMVCDLTGMEVANASLLDEASAAAEAMAMALRASKSRRNRLFVDHHCHPQNIAVIKTRAEPLGIKLDIGNPETDIKHDQVFAAIFQYPGTFGHVCDFTPQIETLHQNRALAIVIADILGLAILKSPGEMQADIAVGSTQRFGIPLGYGGPHAAYIAAQEKFKRAMPGRIVGVSVDERGNRAFRLSLQTREQHIRREKANSNICTAQALLAVMAGMYAVFHGPDGIKAIAQSVHRKTVRLAIGLESLGFTVEPEAFFDTITVDVGPLQGVVCKAAEDQGVNLRAIGENRIGISLDEKTYPETIETVWKAFGGDITYDSELVRDYRLPHNALRESSYLSHPIFHMNRAEAEMTRYMRRLADRDLALDRAMIPLGSCTMKLNATSEMIPLSWPAFADVHPYAPKRQTLGYANVIESLSDQLKEITGYDTISMQPNSGAQGELAGLLAIRRYFLANDQAQRKLCLIPDSAHGTNPASAQMVGWTVVGVKSNPNGEIDLDDFRAKALSCGAELAAAMITYPSTHGIFEEGISQLCEIVHAQGGQVYMDGANLNAMVGLLKPAELGADVGHMNLHKTFCIPHGGGGPGMGPIGVRSHLTPFLPGDPAACDEQSEGAVAATAYGSPLLLPISLIYCLLMGSKGLEQASRIAILNANYIMRRLSHAYPILFRSRTGHVAHECILDTRVLKERAGITVDDLSKRLIDCGFHAPTVSWPVPGTVMIEPTESEPKAELDRFCDAMLAIHDETEAIATGQSDPTNNPLRRAPHTVEDLVGAWDRPYSREQGCFPPGTFRVDKYWPPVNRIDNAFGDRNLVCTCPPVSAYEDPLPVEAPSQPIPMEAKVAKG